MIFLIYLLILVICSDKIIIVILGGMALLEYSTSLGKCINGNSLEVLQGFEDNSIDLVVTSPPFALQRQKEYGNETQENYVDWFMNFARIVYRKLKDTGSFVVDLGGAYEKGKKSTNCGNYYTKCIAKCLCIDTCGRHTTNRRIYSTIFTNPTTV